MANFATGIIPITYLFKRNNGSNVNEHYRIPKENDILFLYVSV